MQNNNYRAGRVAKGKNKRNKRRAALAHKAARKAKGKRPATLPPRPQGATIGTLAWQARPGG